MIELPKTARVLCFRGRYFFLSNLYRDEEGFQVEELYQAQKRRRGDLEVMEPLLRRKFENPRSRQLLLETGAAELVEGNWWSDVWWGQCPVGVGSNELGKMLMRLREEFRVKREKEKSHGRQ